MRLKGHWIARSSSPIWGREKGGSPPVSGGVGGGCDSTHPVRYAACSLGSAALFGARAGESHIRRIAMTVSDTETVPDVGMDRSGLVMVKAEPFNAETPLDAFRAPVTPTPLHYVRSN